jgi:predicted DNA-binding protein (MmcQ/YjbR family)
MPLYLCARTVPGASILPMAGKHPRMIDPGHPIVKRVRKICLAYPEAVEVESWGRPSFRAGKRIFVLVSSMDHPGWIVFKPGPGEHDAYLEREGFHVPPYWGASGWLAIDGDAAGTDWQEVREIIDTSYRQVALKRQLAELDK